MGAMNWTKLSGSTSSMMLNENNRFAKCEWQAIICLLRAISCHLIINLIMLKEKARLSEANKKRGAIIVLNVRAVTCRLRATSYISDARQEWQPIWSFTSYKVFMEHKSLLSSLRVTSCNMHSENCQLPNAEWERPTVWSYVTVTRCKMYYENNK